MTTQQLSVDVRAERRRKLYHNVRDFAARGWSLIPLCPRTKRPAVKWKPYQFEPACDRELRHWFLHRGLNVAVIFGEVSGGLGSRDFDTLEAYELWTQQHPLLAATLPTVETRRGRHVYFRAEAQAVKDVRNWLGLGESKTGSIDLGDGELRCGVGCYSVLPPSTHPSGFVYRWLIAPDSDFPLVDPLVFTGDYHG